jgi:hypothetical protein
LPDLIGLVLKGKIDPGKVFDLTLPLDQVAEGYRAMDERRAIKTLLRPQGAWSSRFIHKMSSPNDSIGDMVLKSDSRLKPRE